MPAVAASMYVETPSWAELSVTPRSSPIAGSRTLTRLESINGSTEASRRARVVRGVRDGVDGVVTGGAPSLCGRLPWNPWMTDDGNS